MPLYDAMEAEYAWLAQQLDARGLVYIHLVDHSPQGAPHVPDSIKANIRKAFKRTLILSGGYDAARAESDLAAGKCDLVAFGRTIRLAPDGSLGGDGRVAAERIEIEGRIAGSLRAAGRYVAINGEVGGKVDLIARRIVIGPNAVIAGDLVYRSGTKPEIAEGARIEGSLREVESKLPEMKSLLRTIVGIGITLIALWVVAGLATVAIVALAFPAVIGNAAAGLRAHPWSSLGRGIVILFAAVVLAILFFVTIVAIPLGATLAVAIVVLKLFGLVTVSACIGLWLRGLIRRSAGEAGKAGRIGWTVIGTIVVGIVMLIPFVGTAVSGLAIVAGAGASAIELWTRLRAAG